MTNDTSPNVRARAPKAKLALVALLIGSTLLGAAANMMPFHIPTAHEIQQAEQTESMLARRERIAVLRAQWNAEPPRCQVDNARELARALVLDGQSAVAYTDDYERRCGTDHVVRKWGKASRLLAFVAAARP